MIIFELTMPNCGSWNGKWSGEERFYAKFKECDFINGDIDEK